MSVEDTKKNNASERLLSHAKLTNANIYNRNQFKKLLR